MLSKKTFHFNSELTRSRARARAGVRGALFFWRQKRTHNNTKSVCPRKIAYTRFNLISEKLVFLFATLETSNKLKFMYVCMRNDIQFNCDCVSLLNHSFIFKKSNFSEVWFIEYKWMVEKGYEFGDGHGSMKSTRGSKFHYSTVC